jgi:hypothetical protein
MVASSRVRRDQPHHATERLAQMRRWSVLLDSAFRIPGTGIRFGLDPIIGLIPGIGDLTTPIFSVVLLAHAFKARTPKVVQVRMLLNVAIDALIGVIPLVGDLFDFGWKANAKNLALLEQHLTQPQRRTKGDWIFVGLVIGVIALCALIPILLLAWVLTTISQARALP